MKYQDLSSQLLNIEKDIKNRVKEFIEFCRQNKLDQYSECPDSYEMKFSDSGILCVTHYSGAYFIPFYFLDSFDLAKLEMEADKYLENNPEIYIEKVKTLLRKNKKYSIKEFAEIIGIYNNDSAKGFFWKCAAMGILNITKDLKIKLATD